MRFFIFGVVLLLTLVILVYLGYQVSWVGFSGKTVWDWLGIIVVPVFLGISVLLVDFFWRRNEKISASRALADQQSLAKEQFSRRQFDGFLNYFAANGKSAEGQWQDHELNALKYKSRVMFRTMTPFWIGELFDFIGASNLTALVPKIFDDNDFKDIDFSGAILKNAKINNSSFSNCNAATVVFVGGTFLTVHFTSCMLSGANFTKVDLRNTFFRSSSLIGLQMRNATVGSCNYYSCLLKRSRIEFAKILSVLFEDCSFEDTVFDGSRFVKTTFKSCNFKGTSLENTKFSESRFENCVFADMQLSGAEFSEVTFEQCKFESTDFSGIDILSASFLSCTFSKDCTIIEEMVANQEEILIGDEADGLLPKTLDLGKPLLEKKFHIGKSRIKGGGSIILTPEELVLASIRKNGMQYKKDGMQLDIVKAIFTIITNASEGDCDKVYLLENVKNMLGNLSNNRISGVVNILLFAGGVSHSSETGLFSCNANLEVSLIDLHNEFLAKKFSEFGAEFNV